MMSVRPDGNARIIFPSGMLGAGFPRTTISRGIEMGASAIAIDAGSTDSGPHYLGSGTSKSSASAVERDLRILLVAARKAQIPLLVGSCGTAGTDAGVDWVAAMVRHIAREERLSFRLALIYSELSQDVVLRAMDMGRVRPLSPSRALEPDDVRSCAHIVGLMGHKPMLEALYAGADVVLAGRATDTATVAAVALAQGLPPGPTWHAAKTVECGGQCTTNPRVGGVLVEIDAGGFTVTPLADNAACTPTSVAAHMMYENADPFRLTEPSGILDTSSATYRSLDDRSVRVEGSRFESAAKPTIKLEGARLAGYETISLVGIRDPEVLAHLDTWVDGLRGTLHARIRSALELAPDEYQLQFRSYGAGAILGDLEPAGTSPREAMVMFSVRAADQATASAIAKTANPLLLHMPLPSMDHLPSFAFATSPAEIDRGAAYEFVLNHVIEVEDEGELFRSEISEVVGV